MYGGGYNNYGGGGMGERASDNFIQQHVPGGLNGPMGERMDNMFGGNPNPTSGQIYGGAPGVGGNNMGGGFGGGYGGQGGNMGGGFGGGYGGQGGNMGGGFGGGHHHQHGGW